MLFPNSTIHSFTDIEIINFHKVNLLVLCTCAGEETFQVKLRNSKTLI